MRTQTRDETGSSAFANVAPRRKLVPAVRQLTTDQWPELKETRLRALKDSPKMFLSTYEREIGYADERWEDEFKRGDWYTGRVDGRPACMLGVTVEQDMPPGECYIEFMWVAPDFRRSGVGRSLLEEILGNLRDTGCKTVYLWVLTGNDVAANLYKTMGFAWTGRRQRLEGQPGRFECQMRLHLTGQDR